MCIFLVFSELFLCHSCRSYVIPVIPVPFLCCSFAVPVVPVPFRCRSYAIPVVPVLFLSFLYRSCVVPVPFLLFLCCSCRSYDVSVVPAIPVIPFLYSSFRVLKIAFFEAHTSVYISWSHHMVFSIWRPVYKE